MILWSCSSIWLYKSQITTITIKFSCSQIYSKKSSTHFKILCIRKVTWKILYNKDPPQYTILSPGICATTELELSKREKWKGRNKPPQIPMTPYTNCAAVPPTSILCCPPFLIYIRPLLYLPITIYHSYLYSAMHVEQSGVKAMSTWYTSQQNGKWQDVW